MPPAPRPRNAIKSPHAHPSQRRNPRLPRAHDRARPAGGDRTRRQTRGGRSEPRSRTAQPARDAGPGRRRPGRDHPGDRRRVRTRLADALNGIGRAAERRCRVGLGPPCAISHRFECDALAILSAERRCRVGLGPPCATPHRLARDAPAISFGGPGPTLQPCSIRSMFAKPRRHEIRECGTTGPHSKNPSTTRQRESPPEGLPAPRNRAIIAQ